MSDNEKLPEEIASESKNSTEDAVSDEIQNVEQPADMLEEQDPQECDDEEAVPVALIDYDEERTDEEYEEVSVSARIAKAAGVEEVPKYKREKLPFKEEVENFFYHYKTILLVVIGAAVLLTLVMLNSRPTPVDYCVPVFAGAENMMHLDSEKLVENLTECGRDIDENGEIYVTTPDYNFFSQDDYYGNIIAMLYFDQDVTKEYASYVLLVDRVHYDEMVKNYTEDVFESFNGLPKWIPLKDTSFLKACAFEGNVSGTDFNKDETDELGLVMMRRPVKLPKSKKKAAAVNERYEQSVELFENILAKYPDIAKNASAN